MNNLWELEEAEEALYKKQYQLSVRYISKALEAVRCMYCHKGDEGREVRPHFKGWVHIDCEDKYNGRIDYENKKLPSPSNDRTSTAGLINE